MEVTSTTFEGLKIIQPKVFIDPRGFFMESYNKNQLSNAGIHINFVQDNHSKSVRGVIRGLHYQLEPYAQTKLIRVLQGEILDVVVDIRKESKTFGHYYSILLSPDNKKQLLIPKGFAHGFSVLSATAEILYKCDTYYAPEYERGILYNDPELNIDWKLDISKAIISNKDKNNPLLKNAEINFNN